MRNIFLENKSGKTGDRIKYLMDKKGIKNADELAMKMYEVHLITDTEKSKGKERCSNIARAINLHLEYDTPEKLSGIWLKRYCIFFGCSADFILGNISMPSHSLTNIHNYTGLSEDAIEVLHSWKKTGDLSEYKYLKEGDGLIPFGTYAWARNALTAISELIECKTLFQSGVLKYVADYCLYNDSYRDESKKMHELRSKLHLLKLGTDSYRDESKKMDELRYKLHQLELGISSSLFMATNGLSECVKKIYEQKTHST